MKTITDNGIKYKLVPIEDYAESRVESLNHVKILSIGHAPGDDKNVYIHLSMPIEYEEAWKVLKDEL